MDSNELVQVSTSGTEAGRSTDDRGRRDILLISSGDFRVGGWDTGFLKGYMKLHSFIVDGGIRGGNVGDDWGGLGG